MLAGRYREASDQFDALDGTGHLNEPEWYLKRRMAAFLTHTYGIDTQDRDSNGADAIAVEAEGPDDLRRSLELDLLCGHALWKLALQAAETDGPALDLFLASAFAEPSLPQPAACLQALIQCIRHDNEIIALVGMAARRLAGRVIIDMLLTEGDVDLVSMIEQLFEGLPDDPLPPAELRLHGPDPANSPAVIDLNAGQPREPDDHPS